MIFERCDKLLIPYDDLNSQHMYPSDLAEEIFECSSLLGH